LLSPQDTGNQTSRVHFSRGSRRKSIPGQSKTKIQKHIVELIFLGNLENKPKGKFSSKKGLKLEEIILKKGYIALKRPGVID
jgi:hypothetical protein